MIQYHLKIEIQWELEQLHTVNGELQLVHLSINASEHQTPEKRSEVTYKENQFRQVPFLSVRTQPLPSILHGHESFVYGALEGAVWGSSSLGHGRSVIAF